MPLTLAIDLDEILSDTLSGFVAFHNQIYRTELSPDDFFTAEWSQVLGDSIDETAQKIRYFLDSEHFELLEPVPGSQAGVQKLRQSYRLVIITSRWGVAVDKTEPWLDRYFPSMFSEIYFSRNAHNDSLSHGAKTKAELCADIGASLLVEDCIDYALQCERTHIHAVLLDKPWNRQLERVEHIARAMDWSELPSLIDSILSENSL